MEPKLIQPYVEHIYPSKIRRNVCRNPMDVRELNGERRVLERS
jgi:hypothetical protein